MRKRFDFGAAVETSTQAGKYASGEKEGIGSHPTTAQPPRAFERGPWCTCTGARGYADLQRAHLPLLERVADEQCEHVRREYHHVSSVLAEYRAVRRARWGLAVFCLLAAAAMAALLVMS
jgi:hypothetical protein